jgi:hypothetical protein
MIGLSWAMTVAKNVRSSCVSAVETAATFKSIGCGALHTQPPMSEAIEASEPMESREVRFECQLMAFYKENNLMIEIIDDGGNPPVVEPNPTSGKLTLVAHLKSRQKTHGYSEGIADEVQVALVKMAMYRNALSIEQVPSDVDENQFLMPIQVTDQVTIGDNVFDGFYDKRLMRFLDVAKPIKLKKRNVRTVLILLAEQTGYNTDAVENLEHGDLGAPIMAIQGGHYSKRMSTLGCAPIVMYFYSISLEPMSVSDFGNFLYAIKHHGDEVALATLRHIYENAE